MSKTRATDNERAQQQKGKLNRKAPFRDIQIMSVPLKNGSGGLL